MMTQSGEVERGSKARSRAPARRGWNASLRVALVVVGALTLTAQVLLLRELLTAWRGNEMSFGIALSVWLGAGGVGSGAYGLIARRASPGRGTLAAAIAGLGALAPSSLLVARGLRGAMGLTAGEVSGLGPLVSASLISLAPFALLAGFTFALAASVVQRESGENRTAAGKAYLLEAAGAASGGLAVSFLFLPRLNPVSIALLAFALSLAAGAFLLFSSRPNRRRFWALAATAAVLALIAAAPPLSGRIDDVSVAAQWRNMGFVSQSNSVYGRVITTRTGSQRSIYESGVLSASTPDLKRAEETAHLPMLLHPGPRRVLLLGGGLGGAVAELLKHPTVTSIDYVELDPELVHEARRAFGSTMTAGLDDPRVTVHFADARFFVKRAGTSGAHGPYDVVILGVPDPTTAQLNRFFTSEFLLEVGAVMADGGVIGLSVQSAENYVSDELARFLASLRATAQTVFPLVVMYPGDTCHIVASHSGAALTRDPGVLASRVAARGLDVVHVRDYYLEDRLSIDRLDYFDSALRDVRGPINSDLFPATYYLSMILWNRQFSGSPLLLQAARRLAGTRTTLLAGSIIVLLLAAPALVARLRRDDVRLRANFRRTVFAAVFIVGATEISMELTALLAFQSIYGYVYHQLALIVAAFMAGLAIGAWAGTRAATAGAGVRTFAAIQICIAATPVLLGFALAGIAGLPSGALLVWSRLFPLVVVASALLAGAQFPVAVSILSGPRTDAGVVGGRLYCADLLGAALGAPVTAVILLPVMGVAGATRALTILNAAVLVSLLLGAHSRTRERPPAR